MNPTLTTILAVWGATISTFVFLWDIRKWQRNKPQIVAKIQFHEGFSEDEGGWGSYEIRNRGGRATTIEELMLVKYQDGIWGWFRFYEQSENVWVKHPETVKLPVMVQPGEVWKGHSPGTGKAYRRSIVGVNSWRTYLSVCCRVV
jgi:hypothetical protein